MYQSTLNVSRTSEGTLAEQAGIYAESWEASQKRVKAAAQGIYDSLLNDEAFIGLNNNLEKLLGGIEVVVDTLGGMSGVLLLTGSIFTKLYAGKIADGLRATAQNVRILTGEEERRNNAFRGQVSEQVDALLNENQTISREIDLLQRRTDVENKIYQKRNLLSEAAKR